jgi:acetyl esterase
VRLYFPDPSPPHPAVMFLHGGGWALGSAERSDTLCRALCRASGMLIASVEYRLAPEHQFTAGLDDAYAALCWLDANGAEIGAVPGKLAVCGDSAGGNLAAAVALMSRDRRGPEIALQVLIYPALDPTLSESSMEKLSSGYGLTRADMQYFWELYLKSPEDEANPYASPLREQNLRGVAPALAITADHDPLVDEGERYAALLRDAGVQVRTIRYPGMIHGFMSYLGRIDAAKSAVTECADALSHAMATQLRRRDRRARAGRTTNSRS